MHLVPVNDPGRKSYSGSWEKIVVYQERPGPEPGLTWYTNTYNIQSTKPLLLLLLQSHALSPSYSTPESQWPLLGVPYSLFELVSTVYHQNDFLTLNFHHVTTLPSGFYIKCYLTAPLLDYLLLASVFPNLICSPLRLVFFSYHNDQIFWF